MVQSGVLGECVCGRRGRGGEEGEGGEGERGRGPLQSRRDRKETDLDRAASLVVHRRGFQVAHDRGHGLGNAG